MVNLSGWIKLPRWLVTDEVFGDSRLWHVYIYLLTQANYEPRTLRNGIRLDIGDCVISQEKVRLLLNIPRGSFRKHLNSLQELGHIQFRGLGGQQGTFVSILNYGEIQGKDADDRTANRTANRTVNRTANRTANRTQNKKKRIKEEKKKEVSLDDLEFSDGLDTSEVRSKLLEWVEYSKVKHNSNLDDDNLQGLLNYAKDWSSELFCRSVDYSKGQKWKSLCPAPNDGIVTRQALPKKRQKSASELVKEQYDRKANEAMKKARTTDDPEEKKQYLDLVQDLAKKRDALETPSE
jgi:hypothetical protein